MQRMKARILVFDGVEVLDFAGPFEVFSRTRLLPGVESRRSEESAPFEVALVAREPGVVRATGGLEVVAPRGFDDPEGADLLVVPGGFGTRALLEDEQVLEWIERSAAGARLVCSVCTGALLLARIGALRGRRATTHWAALDLLAELDPTIDVRRAERVVHDGVVTSAGVAAGIDMAFSVVESLHGAAVANETARYIEYPR